MSFAFLHWKKIVEKNLTSKEVATRNLPQDMWPPGPRRSRRPPKDPPCQPSRQLNLTSSPHTENLQKDQHISNGAKPEIQKYRGTEIQRYRNAGPMDNDRHSANQQWCQMNDIGTFLSALNLVRRRGLDMSMRHQIFMAYLSGFHHFFTTLKCSTVRPWLLYLTWHGAFLFHLGQDYRFSFRHDDHNFLLTLMAS